MYPTLKLIVSCTALIICSKSFTANLYPYKKINDKPINCSNISKSILSFKTVLNDIEQYYDDTGGEISSILSINSNTYVVNILQEGRIDRLSYSIKADENCEIEILDKKEKALDPMNLT